MRKKRIDIKIYECGDRIDRKTLPEGLYAFGVRENGSDGDSIHPFVVCNHMMDIICDKPIELEGIGDFLFLNWDDFQKRYNYEYIRDLKDLTDKAKQIKTTRGIVVIG